MGFQHANCGGACVRGGQAQWELLHRVMPARYRQWEDAENALRADLGKDHAMMVEQVNGTRRPLPLTLLRERLESQPDLFDENDWGACGCTEFPVELTDFPMEEHTTMIERKPANSWLTNPPPPSPATSPKTQS